LIFTLTPIINPYYMGLLHNGHSRAVPDGMDPRFRGEDKLGVLQNTYFYRWNLRLKVVVS